MCDGIMLTIDDDGVAHEYDDTYDIVVHCESQEDQDKAREKLTRTKWIPCSERLPELDDEVLVTDDRGELRHCIFCTWGETWCGFVTYEEGMRIEPVAWMPLPEPYREVEE